MNELKIKIAKKVGSFELLRLNRNGWSIRVINNSTVAPVAVEIYTASGLHAEHDAKRLFDEVTRAWETALSTQR
jgi:hypothetical protein